MKRYPVAIAPMVDKTHRWFRSLARLFSRRVLLYTEMITAQAIIRGDRDRLLGFSTVEKPLVLQIGAGNVAEAADAVRIAEDWEFEEVNLNAGCPSDRVQNGQFGACLMADPDRVADIVSAMAAETAKSVTVKYRIGIKSPSRGIELEDFDQLERFTAKILAAGAKRCIVHARIALLDGLSPKDNRRVPPLEYDTVYRLKQRFPETPIEMNGGIRTHREIAEHLARVDSVMIGRAAYEDPYILAEIDRRYFDPFAEVPSREEIIEGAFRLLEEQSSGGANIRNLVWPLLELFSGLPGTRRWKRALSGPVGDAPREFLAAACAAAPREWLSVRGSARAGEPV